jgi:general secretion pathway protein M
MREWYESLVPREQLMVGFGAVLAILMFYFLIFWEPLSQTRKALVADVAQQRELAVFMQQAEQEARQYAGSGAAIPADNNRSLLAIVDSSGKQAGMGPFIKRIQPEGETTVRLWIEDAPFEKLTAWLYQLQIQQGVNVDNGSLDRDSKVGVIKARLTVTRSAP